MKMCVYKLKIRWRIPIIIVYIHYAYTLKLLSGKLNQKKEKKSSIPNQYNR